MLTLSAEPTPGGNVSTDGRRAGDNTASMQAHGVTHLEQDSEKLLGGRQVYHRRRAS